MNSFHAWVHMLFKFHITESTIPRGWVYLRAVLSHEIQFSRSFSESYLKWVYFRFINLALQTSRWKTALCHYLTRDIFLLLRKNFNLKHHQKSIKISSLTWKLVGGTIRREKRGEIPLALQIEKWNASLLFKWHLASFFNQ